MENHLAELCSLLLLETGLIHDNFSLDHITSSSPHSCLKSISNVTRKFLENSPVRSINDLANLKSNKEEFDRISKTISEMDRPQELEEELDGAIKSANVVVMILSTFDVISGNQPLLIEDIKQEEVNGEVLGPPVIQKKKKGITLDSLEFNEQIVTEKEEDTKQEYQNLSNYTPELTFTLSSDHKCVRYLRPSFLIRDETNEDFIVRGIDQYSPVTILEGLNETTASLLCERGFIYNLGQLANLQDRPFSYLLIKRDDLIPLLDDFIEQAHAILEFDPSFRKPRRDVQFTYKGLETEVKDESSSESPQEIEQEQPEVKGELFGKLSQEVVQSQERYENVKEIGQPKADPLPKKRVKKRVARFQDPPPKQ